MSEGALRSARSSPARRGSRVLSARRLRGIAALADAPRLPLRRRDGHEHDQQGAEVSWRTSIRLPRDGVRGAQRQPVLRQRRPPSTGSMGAAATWCTSAAAARRRQSVLKTGRAPGGRARVQEPGARRWRARRLPRTRPTAVAAIFLATGQDAAQAGILDVPPPAPRGRRAGRVVHHAQRRGGRRARHRPGGSARAATSPTPKSLGLATLVCAAVLAGELSLLAALSFQLRSWPPA